MIVISYAIYTKSTFKVIGFGGGDLLSDDIKDRKSNRNSNMNFDTKQSAISGGKTPPNNTLSTNVHIVEYLDLSFVSLSLSHTHPHARIHTYDYHKQSIRQY